LRRSVGPYFQTQGTQDIRRRITNCFVVVEAVTGQVAAYYTLSAPSVSFTELPPDETKHLPRYSTLPAIRIGRLVDEKLQGRGLEAAMLMNAIHRTLESATTVVAERSEVWVRGLWDQRLELAPVAFVGSCTVVSSCWQLLLVGWSRSVVMIAGLPSVVFLRCLNRSIVWAHVVGE
jgi:hypothetical protein